MPGRWFLPGGGVELGERPRDTVVRGFAEETVLQVAVGPLLGASDDLTPSGSDTETTYTMRIVYEVELVASRG